MERATILRLFLNKGTQVDEGALGVLSSNPNILESILPIEKGKLPAVITVDFLESLSTTPSKNAGQQKMSIDQLSQILNYRYSFLRDLLMDRQELTNLISINRISERTKQFSVIGVVTELNDMLMLEDSTGQAAFMISKELSRYIVEDEVIGLVCEHHTGSHEVKNVIYPDIPLKKEDKKTERTEKCLFISDIVPTKFNGIYYKNFLGLLEREKNLKVFILSGASSNEEDISRLLSDIPHPIYFYSDNDLEKPVTFQIENIKLLLIRGTFLQHYMSLWGAQPDIVLVNLLKKRNLNPILTPKNYNNSFLLEVVPDVIVVSGTKPTSTNYKGTTILTTGNFNTEPIYWLINLQTRETFKIDFS